MQFRRLLFAVIAVAAMTVSSTLAGDMGSVSGAVFGPGGTLVADATVKISGDLMPAGRTVRTDENGMFRFQALLPGKYTVQVEKTGVGATSRDVQVDLDKDTQVELVIGVEVKEEVTVSAATPVVDLKSSEVNFNYKAEQIAALPLQRNYSGLFQLIPGVAENNSFAPSGGGSRQDNKYLMDGVDITNPGFGYLSTEVNGLDIAEFNVKRGAITAEFGRASGFVTNAISKSGTNQLRGIVFGEMRPRRFSAKSNSLNTAGEIVEIPSTIDRYVASFSLGGPAIRDRLFWYGSSQWVRSRTTGRTNALGDVPDRTETTKEFFGKLTGQPTSKMFVNAGYRFRPSTCDLCGIGNTDAASVARNTEGDTRVATATWSWFPANRTVIDARYIHMEENAENLPVVDLGFQPTFNPNNLAEMGQFSDTTGPFAVTRGAHNLRSEQVDFKRNEFRATVTQFFDLGGTNHQLKGGFGYEEGSEILDRKSNGWGTLAIVGGGTQIQATYYSEQPAQLSPGKTYSLFVQDDISIGSRLVVNAGVLMNRDEYSQVLANENTFLTFNFGDEVQPRLGINYQLRKGHGDKVYGNYGRYYAMDQKSSARSLAPSRMFFTDAIFNRTTGALISDIPRASTTGKLIDAGLDPTYADEWLIGYATPISTSWGLELFYTNREVFDLIEDVPSSLPATGPFRAAQLTGGERKYKAFTVELSRRLMNHWSMTTSYAWSRFEGNFDLDILGSGAVFNTSSGIQDAPGRFVEDRFRYGPLSQDRPHVFKVFATYEPPVIPNLTIGGYLRSQSGSPWAARGIDWDNAVSRFLEPAGTHRNDVWTNVDLLGAYRLRLNGRAGLKFEGRVLNLFGQLTTLNVDQRQFLDARIRPAVSAFAVCGTDYACATELFTTVQTTNQPNSRFGKGSEWAPPRRFFFSIQADF